MTRKGAGKGLSDNTTMGNVIGSIRPQCVCTLLVALVLFRLPVPAQEASGRIIGVVTDPSGSPARLVIEPVPAAP